MVYNVTAEEAIVQCQSQSDVGSSSLSSVQSDDENSFIAGKFSLILKILQTEPVLVLGMSLEGSLDNMVVDYHF